MASQIGCRFCGTALKDSVVDLGMSPLANSYLPASHIHRMEPFYPLKLYVCHECFLVQVQEVESPAHIFTDYAYFSSYSQTWLEHSKNYCEMVSERFGLGPTSQVTEIASNDGYLLQYFVKKGIPSLGIEPAANVAVVALEKGVPSLVKFFGSETASQLVGEGRSADLLIGNNVLAHVPDLNDFVKGMKILLKPEGVITMEFPHLMQLFKFNQFDTIYHEHFSYFSLTAVQKIFAQHGLTLFDVERLTTHGGSLRIYAAHLNSKTHLPLPSVKALLGEEEEAGVRTPMFYRRFSDKVIDLKSQILEFLIQARRARKSVAAFGAPAKGNTLLNYCGIKSEFIQYAVDDTPSKQGRFLPGSHIPVFSAKQLELTKPDYVVVMPWNFKDEIVSKHQYIRKWGGRFVTFIPEVSIQ